jgi:hypothetical protein
VFLYLDLYVELSSQFDLRRNIGGHSGKGSGIGRIAAASPRGLSPGESLPRAEPGTEGAVGYYFNATKILKTFQGARDIFLPTYQ